MTTWDKIQSVLQDAPDPWLILLFILCLLDGIGTAVGIHYGVVQEANPILSWVLHHWGLRGFLGVKLLGMNLPCIAILGVGSRMTDSKILSRAPMVAFWAYLVILSGSIGVQYFPSLGW